MAFNRFHIQILVRLVLIIINVYVYTFIFFKGIYWLTLINLAILVVLQTYLLLRYITRWQRDLEVIREAVKQNDYGFHFNVQDKEHHPFKELYLLINQIGQDVRMIKNDAAQQGQYFQYIIENAQVGLIVYNAQGEILIISRESIRLLNGVALKNIHELKNHAESLYTQIINLKLSQPQLIVDPKNPQIKLSARLSRIIVKEQTISIVSLVNIKPEIEANELQTWQELISILTHEIMNSIAPIHSLNGTMSKYLDKIEGNEQTVEKARNSLEVINRRSKMLMNFVERYRTISTVPLPHLIVTSTDKLISPVLQLLSDELQAVSVIYDPGQSATVNVDPVQMEQVLINIIKNALHAVAEISNPQITIQVAETVNKVSIIISDNGKGIAPENLDKIFIPFYTTRTSGSGIGLTLSRQILHRHEGSIEVSSTLGQGTTIQLILPAI